MSSSSGSVRQMAELLRVDSSGKQKIAMEGIFHAVSGQRLFMTGDELECYMRNGASYIADLQPVGFAEEQLAQKIIDTSWWLNRANAIESNLLSARCLENSSQSDRVADVRTEAILSQALGFSEECGSSNSFDILSKCSSRVMRLHLAMVHELERVQAKRRGKNPDTFVLEDCRVYRWYTEQLQRFKEVAKVETRTFTAG